MDDQKEVRTKTPAIIVILLLILVFGIAYLCFSDFREKNSTEIIDSTRSVLLVQFADGDDNPEYSDTTQVRNAMDSGGMIIIDVTMLTPLRNHGLSLAIIRRLKCRWLLLPLWGCLELYCKSWLEPCPGTKHRIVNDFLFFKVRASFLIL